MTNFLMLQVLFHNAAICKLTPRKSVPALYGKQKQFLLVDVYEFSVFKDYYGVLSLIEFRSRTDQNSTIFLYINLKFRYREHGSFADFYQK